MKRLKFLIVALGVFAAQGVFAVTLPSTSYNDHSSYVTVTDEYSVGGTLTQSGSFMQLGAIPYDDCTAIQTFQGCEQCCQQKVLECYQNPSIPDKSECNTLSQNCNNDCGRSLPLDAPLWFLLVIAVLSVTLRAYARRVSQAVRRTE